MSQDSVAQVTCRVEKFTLSHWLICRNFGRQAAHELPISLHAASYAFASPLSAILKNLEERTINSKDRRTRKCVRWMYTSLAVSVGRKSWWSSESLQLRSLWRRLFMEYVWWFHFGKYQESRRTSFGKFGSKTLIGAHALQAVYLAQEDSSALCPPELRGKQQRQVRANRLRISRLTNGTSCTSCTKNQKTYLLSLVVTCCFQVWVSRVPLVWESCCIISFWNRTCRPKCQLSITFMVISRAEGCAQKYQPDSISCLGQARSDARPTNSPHNAMHDSAFS